MAWRDRLDIRGSFRGVEFILDDDSYSGGRRAQPHEYPMRDKPWVEDLGRKGREFEVDCYVIGPDYDLQRNRLIQALEEEGPGTLVHPRYGSMRVSVTDFRNRESTARQGIARFTISFFEGGDPQFPAQSVDTPTQVQNAADATLAESIEDFADTFDVLGQAADLVDETEQELERVLGAIVAVTGAVTGPIASLIRSPANMASAIVDAIGEISNAVGEPARALQIYTGQFDAGEDSPPVPGGTKAREKQQRNVEAIHWLVRRAAIAEAARSLSQGNQATRGSGGQADPAELDWPSREDVITARDSVLDGIEDQVVATDVDGQPIDDSVYASLVELRAAVVEDIRVRAAQLARLTSYTPRATQPALMISQTLYDDPDRADEILTRNRVRHPLFVRGAEPLEVLSNE